MIDVDHLPLVLWDDPAETSADRSRITATWLEEVDRDPRLRKVFVVAELIMGDGTRVRVAVRMLNSVNALGDDRGVAAALLANPEIVNNYEVGSPSAGTRSVNLQVPGWVIDPRARLESGLPIAGFGELSLLRDGMPWHRRRVILRGDLVNVRFGSAHQTGTLLRNNLRAAQEQQIAQVTVQDPRLSADRDWPGALVDVEAWPDADSSGTGGAVPRIFGRFVVPGRRVANTPEQVLVGDGHNLEALTVWQNDVDITAQVTLTPTRDGRGREVSVVEDTSGGLLTWADGDRVYIDAQRTDAPNPRLVDVIRDAVTSTPYGAALLNEQLMADAEARIPALATVSLASNSSATLFRFIEGDLLGSWPMVCMAFDQGRWGPIVTDWRAPVQWELTAGTADLGDRITDWAESSKFDLLNNFEFRYGYDARLDSWAGTLRRNPDNDATCAASASASGKRSRLKVVDLFSVDSEDAATYVADWWVSHKAIPSLYAEFAAPASAFLRHRRADPGLLADPEFGISDARATMERIRYARDGCRIGFRVWQSRYRGAAAI